MVAGVQEGALELALTSYDTFRLRAVSPRCWGALFVDS